MAEPKFVYHPTTPPDVEPTSFRVYTDGAPEVDDAYLGTVYQTADKGWVADWSKRNDAPAIAMPGFQSQLYAAQALYWFAPPAQSVRSRPIGQSAPVSDERIIDLSGCGCCVSNDCDCEGLNRISRRFGTPQTYAVQPSLIPVHGVLVSLLPLGDGDFLVDFNTRGVGTGIGYLLYRDDGCFNVRIGSKEIGVAATQDSGMWAVFKHHTGANSYERLTQGFEPHEKPVYA
ncbi:hypothetical protein ACFWNT_45530 [Streptomyces sp. NPDC058409]|uniref:hypothetical protein n=1 Tax=Streptomyces sp. NPDC058409 TaxID=3346484 RepID=UPI0036496703